jgi:hypothetical protein
LGPNGVWRVVLPVVVLASVLGLIRFAAPAALRGALTPSPASPTPSAMLAAEASSSPSPVARHGEAPVPIAAGYGCPPSASIAAYGFPLGFHYFPAAHPRRPDPSIRPDGCYGSVAEAVADGFSLGLPPEGWFEAGSLLLAPDWELGMDQDLCWRAAGRLAFELPCLHLFPAPAEISGPPKCGAAFPPNPGCVYRADGQEAFYLQYRSWPGPGIHPLGGQGLTLAAFPEGAAGPGSTFELLFLCGGRGTSGSTSLTFVWTYSPHAYRGSFIVCPEGAPPSGGQTILTWKRAGVIYALGLPLDLEQNRDILIQLAQSMNFVEPHAGP